MQLIIGITGIELLHQDTVCAFLAELLVLPAVVGPGEAKREVWLAGRQHLVEGALQQAASVAKPVVPVAEAFYTILPGHIGLLLAGLGDAQVVVAQVGGDAGLVMSSEQGACLAHIGR